MNKNVICVSKRKTFANLDMWHSSVRSSVCVCVCVFDQNLPPRVCSHTHTHTHSGKRTVRGMCAAIELTRSHNPWGVWNVSSCCQWLKPTLVEQLRYTVSGRVLSLPIRIKRRPLRRWKQEERERGRAERRRCPRPRRSTQSCGV